MKSPASIWLLFLLFLTGCLIVACGADSETTAETTATAPSTSTPVPEASATATTATTPTPGPPTPTVEVIVATATEAADTCGDLNCSEAEQNDPSLCPQDCVVEVSATPEPTVTPMPTETLEPTVVPSGAAWAPITLPSGELAHAGDPDNVLQEGGEADAPRQINAAFILDASGSMNADLPGSGKSKLTVAKEVMSELLPGVPEDVQGALWIYGHRLPDEPKAESCKDIERVFALGPLDAAAYIEQINAANARGYTPISDSIELAALDLPPGSVNSIILVSDGEETCAGDPCALAEALKASDSEVTIHVVGYAVDAATREQLQCIARVSGGGYHDAEDGQALLQGLEEAIGTAVVPTLLRVEVIDPAGETVHANVHLYEPGGDQRLQSYTAWKDNAVLPGSYDLLVDTLPWILYQGLTLAEGSSTIVRIPLGAINVLTPEGQLTSADLYDADAAVRLGHYGHEDAVYVAPGSYAVGVNNSMSDPLRVEAGETKDVLLGAIRPLTAQGEETAVEIFEQDSGQRLGYYGETVLLAPGAYILQVNNSRGQPVAVQAGETIAYPLGAIELPGDFQIFDSSGARLGFYSGMLDLVPGTYRLELDSGQVVEDVLVEPGQITRPAID